LELFKLPRTIGQFEDKDMKVSIGRFGPYISHNSKFYSIPKTDDPYTIEADRAIEIMLAKRKADAEKLIKEFPEEGIQILNGRWGPYFAKEKENYKLPKELQKDPQAITLAQCLEIIAKSPAKPVKAAANKKATVKAAPKSGGKKAKTTTKKKSK
jgi:DNA topoisomerase I